MIYLGDIINKIRRVTLNEDYSTTSGIQDDILADFVSEANRRLQTRIMSIAPDNTLFDVETVIQCVADQRDYDLPDNTFMQSGVRKVEYRRDASTDYENLRSCQPWELRDDEGAPLKWIAVGNGLSFTPIPDSAAGNFRVTRAKMVDDVGLRTGTISAVTITGNDASAYIADITCTSTDDTANAAAENICVVDKFGRVSYYDISVDAYATNTFTVRHPLVSGREDIGSAKTNGAHVAQTTLTVDSGHTLKTGDYVWILQTGGTYVAKTLTATTPTSVTFAGAISVDDDVTFYKIPGPGDFVVIGRFASSHSSLPQECERYLTSFGAWKVLKHLEASMEAAEMGHEVSIIEQDILTSLTRARQRQVQRIPIINEYWS